MNSLLFNLTVLIVILGVMSWILSAGTAPSWFVELLRGLELK